MSYYQDLETSQVSIDREQTDLIVGRFRFSRNLQLFKGHFPGNPMLPGVLQIGMVKYCIEQCLEQAFDLHSVKKTKFSSRIDPEDPISVEIRLSEREEKTLAVKATIKTAGTIAGKATLILTASC